MNLKDWRRRREREARRPKAVTVRMVPETLVERLLRYARASGAQYIEKHYTVDCVMPSGAILTVYREPARHMGGTRPFYFYGEIFYPYRKCCRRVYLNERCAKRLFDRLAQAIDEL